MNSVFHVTLAEINDETEFQSCHPQIGQHLCLENRMPFGEGLVINQWPIR